MDQRRKEELQQEEAIVLESSFGPHLLSIKTQNCWKKFCPLEACIHILPSDEADQVFVYADVYFQCTDTYPNTIPSMRVANSKGLTTTETKVLVDTLKAKAETLKGEPMILELCMACKEFLEARNKKSESVYESMVKQKEMKENERRRQREDSERRENEEIAAVNERRRQESERRKDEERLSAAKTLNLGEVGEALAVKTCFGEEKTVNKKMNYAQHRKPFHRFCTEFGAFDDQRRELLISEWTFAYNPGKTRKSESDFSPFLSKLQSFEYTANLKLKNLEDFDQFLSSYLCVNLVKPSSQSNTFKCILRIGQYLNHDLKCLAEHPGIFQKNIQSLLPVFATQSICGIKWLHDRQQCHGNIDSKSVWITKKDGFCLSDAIFLPELLALCTEFEEICNSTTKVISLKDASPDSPAPKSLRSKMIENQKKDIFNLGTLIDSLTMKDDSSTEDHESDFSKTLHAFIKLCQTSKSVENLIDHKFLSLYFLNISYINNSMSDETSIIPFDQFEHSRLAKDFCNFRFLGKGGFGQVLLARNKLDWKDYAVKVISLPSRADQLIKKVTREVNVLSRLNHPNVVRYYAAWIETSSADSPLNSSNAKPTTSETTQNEDSSIAFETVSSNSDESDSSSSSSSSSASGKKGFFRKPKQSVSLPRIQTIFSPISAATSKSGVNSEFDVIFDDDDEEEREGRNHKLSQVTEEDDDQEKPEDVTSTANLSKLLYIQMEYCEGNTLRALIDTEKLLDSTDLTWKLFRQVLNGLQYIHGCQILHRDIKPGNLFLDSYMNIKIGDFGLASVGVVGMEPLTKVDSDTITLPPPVQGIERTNNVGTSSYMAPECALERTSDLKETYDSKCDVYSLGIVLFEMFYRPLPVGMERVEVIKNLRNMISFPGDFGGHLMDYQKEDLKNLLKSMLALNPKERPTVADLLNDYRIPFVEDEETEFEKKFGILLRNRRSAFHRWVLDELFSLEVPSAADFLYDKGILSDDKSEEPRHQAVISNISRDLRAIFHLHGVCELSADPLVPFNKEKSGVSSSSSVFTLLEKNGYPLALKSDLRQSFARYCARNHLAFSKRFAFGNVFIPAEASGIGIHPTSRYECAVDFIAPVKYASNLGAEILLLIIELEKHIPVLADLKYTLRIGHSKLIEAICHLHGCHGSMLKRIQSSFHSFMTKSQKQTTEAKISRLSKDTKLNSQTATIIIKQLEAAESLDELKARISRLMKNKSNEIKNCAMNALEEISETLENLMVLCEDRKVSIVYDPSLSYRPNIFSDGLCYLLQVEFPNGPKKANVLAGGRYDSYLALQRHANDQSVPELCAYGINISLDMLYSFHNFIENPLSTICRVLVFPQAKQFMKEASTVVKEFRSKNHSASIYYGTSASAAELMDYCKAYCIPFLLTIADSMKYVIYENVLLTKSSRKAIYGDYSQTALSRDDAVQMICSTDLSYSSKVAVASDSNEMVANVNVVSVTSTPSLTTAHRTSASFANFANLSINYALSSGKPAHNTRKKIETQVQLVLQKMIQNINVKTKVEAFVTELMPETLLQIIGNLNRYMNSEDFDRAFQQISAGKQKRELDALQVALSPFFGSHLTEYPPLVLWSRMAENSYKLIM